MDTKPEFEISPQFLYPPGDTRAAALREEQERAHARRLELDSQFSAVKDPQERIRIWERLHALQLPVSPAHPLVRVIAEHTHLRPSDVKEEQQRRRALSRPVAGQEQ